MHFASVVVSGVISPPTAMRPRDASVLSAPRRTLRGTTGAQLRAAGWEEVVCAHTLRRSVRTVEVLTAQGLMPARPRRSPRTQQGVEATAPAGEGEEGGSCCCGPGRRGGGRAGGRGSCRAGGGGNGGVGAWLFRMFYFLFSLFCFLVLPCRSFSFAFCQAGWGEGDLRDTPTMTARAGPGAGNGLPLENPGCLPREGQRQAAATALWAACSGILNN